MKKINTPIKIIIFIIAFVLVGVGGFFGGLKFGQMKGNFAGGMLPGGNQAAFGGQFGLESGTKINRQKIGGGLINGEIISIDDKSLTVKMFGNGSKTVYWSDSTTITKSTSGSTDDLVVGAQVMITGISADGATTAESIQILPTVQIPPSQNE